LESESELYSEMGLESELYSEMISFPARHVERAFAWALLAMQRSYGKCSWSRESAHDGSIVGSHAMAHDEVEFELESDPSSKSAC
jgi:hypothetical protein